MGRSWAKDAQNNEQAGNRVNSFKLFLFWFRLITYNIYILQWYLRMKAETTDAELITANIESQLHPGDLCFRMNLD